MKKVLSILCAVMALTACVKEIQVAEVTVAPAELNLRPGDKQLVKATYSPADATVTGEIQWATSNEAVATVAPTGLITAVAPGTADITATLDGKSGVCKLTVSDTEILGISFVGGTDGALVVNAGEEKVLEVVYNPAEPTNKKLSWAVSDQAKASVTPDAAVAGKAVVKFAASASGMVEVTATTEVGEKVAKQSYVILGEEKLYVAPTEVYAGKKAEYALNTTVYPGLSDAVWTVNGKEYKGDKIEFAVDVEQTLEEAIAGAPMADKAMIGLAAKLNGNEVSAEFEVPVKVFWIEAEIETWSRNSNPVFNKECTKVYFVTRNSDTGVNKRQLVQIDLASKEIKYLDLKMDKEAIVTDNGGLFCVNPKNGDVICCNNQAIYCITEALTKKWQFDVPGTNAKSSASVIFGCGPAMSNACDVVFVPTTTGKFYALNAETGEMLSELDFSANADCLDKSKKYAQHLGNVQFAVWGENNIVMHRNTNSKSMHWITFKDNKLAIEKESNSHSGSLADLTAPVIDKTQSTVYFGGNATVLFAPIKGYDDAKHITGGATGTGLQFSGILSDGYLYYGAQVNSVLSRIDLANPASGFTKNVIEGPQQGNNNRNFDVVSADSENNIYFPYKQAGVGMFMCKGTTAEDGSFTTKVLASCPLSGGNYQGSSNMGNGYMVLCCRNAAGNPCVYVRCIDAVRGEGWTGMGGDVCNTKNANLVWNK